MTSRYDDLVPHEGDRVFILREDGSVQDEGTFDGYYVGRPQFCDVIVSYLTCQNIPTALVIPVRAFKEGMNKNPAITASWIKKHKML